MFLYICQMEGGEPMQTSILWEGSLPSKEEMEHFTGLFKEAGFHNVKIGG